jgi:hypothetical protein
MMDMIVRILRDVKVDKKKKDLFIFLGTIGRLRPQEGCQGKKKPFCFGCWGRWGMMGMSRMVSRYSKGIEKDIQGPWKGIYILLLFIFNYYYLLFIIFFLSNKLGVLKRMPWASRMMPRNYGKKISFLGKRR